MKASAYIFTDENMIDSHFANLKHYHPEFFKELMALIIAEKEGKIQHLPDDFEHFILLGNVYIKSDIIPYLRPGIVLRDDCFEFVKHQKEIKKFLEDIALGVVLIDIWSSEQMEVSLVHASDQYSFAENFHIEKYYRNNKTNKFIS